MGLKSYTSAREKNDLIEFIAATGENYDRYLEWCAARGVKPYTKKYLHTWIQRRRPKIKQMRIKHDEEIQRMSMFDRERRIRELENDLDTLNHLISKNFDIPELLVKLLEQKRKTAQAVAQERGEWNRPEAKEPDGAATRERLRTGALALLEGKATQIIDGKVVVAKD